jgi:hypothetical protein
VEKLQTSRVVKEKEFGSSSYVIRRSEDENSQEVLVLECETFIPKKCLLGRV